MIDVTRRHSISGDDAGVSLLFFGPQGSRTVLLGPGQSVTVGRDAPADVQLRSDGVSRRHAAFTWESDGLKVVDLGSTNGTRLRGQSVETAPLSVGDVLTLGDVTVTVAPRSAGESLAGAEGWYRFSTRVDDEVIRARELSHPFALLELKALGRGVHLSQFVAHVRQKLRPVDSMGMFSAYRLMVLLPESDRARAEKVARAVLKGAPVPLGAAVAGWPQDGITSDQLIAALGRGVLELSRSHSVVHPVAEEPERPITADPAMKALFQTAQKVAASPLNVLILGATGTGKEVLAREIHRSSSRARKPFVAINCGAIAPGLLESTLFGHEKGSFTGAERRRAGVFEQANGGSLFLDEVGELTPQAQAALLRVLETRKVMRVGAEEESSVDVRILSATHRQLDGTDFRSDLLFRLDGVTLRIPPLRERPRDLLALADHFFEHTQKAHNRSVKRLSAPARDALARYPWPGNVRELRNVIERAVVVCEGEEITVQDLGERLADPELVIPAPAPPTNVTGSFKDQVAAHLRALETRLIVEALERTRGNQTRAARDLGLPLRTLVHKMKALDIKKRFS